MSAVDALELAVKYVEDEAVEMTVEDAATLSKCQLRLGEIVLQILDTEKVRKDLDR